MRRGSIHPSNEDLSVWDVLYTELWSTTEPGLAGPSASRLLPVEGGTSSKCDAAVDSVSVLRIDLESGCFSRQCRVRLSLRLYLAVQPGVWQKKNCWRSNPTCLESLCLRRSLGYLNARRQSSSLHLWRFFAGLWVSRCLLRFRQLHDLAAHTLPDVLVCRSIPMSILATCM